MINVDGIKTLKILLRASTQPTWQTHQIETIPAAYKAKYDMKKL